MSLYDAYQYPEILERESAVSYIPNFQNKAGPMALDGTRQVVNGTGGGLWMARFTSVQLRTTEHLLEWEAMEVALEGGKNPIDVPMLLCNQKPTPADGAAIVISANGAASAGAVSMSVDLEHSGVLKKGMHFSDYDPVLYGWRMYRISSVSDSGGSIRSITFWPRLRFAATDNHMFEYEAPRCVMVPESDDALSLEVSMRRRANPNAMFIEAF